MRKLMNALIIVLLIPSFCFGAPLAWNKDQKDTWAKMKAENHAVYQRLKNEARGYEDYGMRDGLMYLITGDVSYAQKAWSQEKWRATKILSGSNDRNLSRHQLNTMALLYSWIYDAIDDQSKKDFTTAMDNWVNFAIANTRASDSDELIGHYFGVALYALAIKSRNPQRYDQLVSAIGGFDATGANEATWRNAVRKFADKARGGQWIESSNYNINTFRYLIIGATSINEFFGVNKFPEYNFNEFAEAQAAELTPNMKDSFQWGDNEEMRQLSKFRRIPMYTALGKLTKNKKVLWALDQMMETGNFQGIWYLYYDPYLARQAITDQVYNAAGMGVASFRKGGRVFFSQFKPRTYVDHEYDDFGNFGLFEDGAWTITNPRGYHSNLYNSARYHNGIRIWGLIPSVFQKKKGQVAFDYGADWEYHAGTVSGQAMQQGGALPTETLKEGSRQIVYLDNEAIVIFDRINARDPKLFGDIDFNKYRSEMRAVYTPYHQLLFHMNDTMKLINGDYVWTSNKRTIRLHAFYPHDYAYVKFDGWGATPASENKNLLTLKTKENKDYMTLLTVIDLTNTAQVVKLGDGKVQVNTTLITFNADKDTPLSFNINRNSQPLPPIEPQSDPTPPPPVEPPQPEPPACVSDGSCSAPVPPCEGQTAGVDNCGVMCTRQGADCPAEIKEITITISEFKKKTSYYLGLVNEGNTRVIVTYYGKPYEIRKKE